MTEILLHRNPIPEETAKRLANEGVIAIQCEDTKAFRFLNAKPISFEADDFIWAALNAMSGFDSACGRFVRDMRDSVNKRRKATEVASQLPTEQQA